MKYDRVDDFYVVVVFIVEVGYHQDSFTNVKNEKILRYLVMKQDSSDSFRFIVALTDVRRTMTIGYVRSTLGISKARD